MSKGKVKDGASEVMWAKWAKAVKSSERQKAWQYVGRWQVHVVVCNNRIGRRSNLRRNVQFGRNRLSSVTQKSMESEMLPIDQVYRTAQVHLPLAFLSRTVQVALKEGDQ